MGCRLFYFNISLNVQHVIRSVHVYMCVVPEGLRRLLLGLEDVSVRRSCFLGGVTELRLTGLL